VGRLTPSRLALLLAQVAPIALLISAVAARPDLWPVRRSQTAAEVAFMIVMFGALSWVPSFSLREAWRMLKRPMLGGVRLVMSMGAADVALGLWILALGEFREIPPPVLGLTALSLYAGTLLIFLEGVGALSRLSKVENSPFDLGELSRVWYTMGLVSTIPLLAAAISVLSGGVGVVRDPRLFVALAGLAPGPALVLAWCLRARKSLPLMAGREGEWLCAAVATYLISIALFSASFSLTPRLLWLAAALGVASASSMAFDRAITYWSLNFLFQRVTIPVRPSRESVVLLEAEPAAYTRRLLAAVQDLIGESRAVLLLTKRGSPLARLVRGLEGAAVAYLTSTPLTHPSALDKAGLEYVVAPSVSQLTSLVSIVSKRMGGPLTVVIDSFNDLLSSLGMGETYSLVRVLSDLVLSQGGRVILISFPAALGAREAAVARTLATEIVLV